MDENTRMIRERLFALQDAAYARFQIKLTPGITEETCIGVRVPELRRLAKELVKEKRCGGFLEELPHRYYDENMLHGMILSQWKEYARCVELTDAFLPYVDNWAVCDTMSPAVFKKHKPELLEKIREWTASPHVYTCRFGIEMLMRYFLDSDFTAGYLDIPASVRSEEYYVNRMVAWFFATALAKQWDAALPYLLEDRLDSRTHNMTIQKARESFRITKERKDFLRTLKR